MHIAYASTNFQKVVCIKTELSSSPHVNVQILTTCCFQSCWYLKLLLTASVDSCVEIKRVPLQWHNQFWKTLEAGAESKAWSVPQRTNHIHSYSIPGGNVSHQSTHTKFSHKALISQQPYAGHRGTNQMQVLTVKARRRSMTMG